MSLTSLMSLMSLLLLTACMGADPYTQRAAANGAIEATTIARQVSAQETAGAITAAEAEGTRYAGELLAVEAQIQGTRAAIEAEQTAVSIQDTRSAADLQATAYRATSQIIQMQSTQAYLVQHAQAMSTATAVVHNRELYATAVAASNQRARSWRFLGLFLGWGLAIITLAMLGTFVYAIYLRARVSAKLFEERELRMMGRDLPRLQELPAGLPQTDGPEATLNFLRRAAAIAGKEASQIPSDDRMKMSARPWSREVHRLVAAGAVAVVPGQGSTIKIPWRNIERLHRAIETGSLKLPPYPTGGGYRYYDENGNGDEDGQYE